MTKLLSQILFIEVHTQALEKLYVDSSQSESLQTQLLSSFHFSHSQQLQLSNLCQSAQSHQINLETLELIDVTQSKQALALIKKHIDQQAVTL